MDSPSKDNDNAPQEDQRDIWYQLSISHAFELHKVLGTRGKLFVMSLVWMNMMNKVDEDQAFIAKALHIDRSQVSRILKDFEKQNACVTGRGWYMINPELAFYGKKSRKLKAIGIYKHKRSKKFGREGYHGSQP